MTAPRAPAGLDAAGRGFWRDILAVYELSPAELRLLARACRTLDLLARLDAAMAAEELMVTGSTGQPRPNPLLSALADQQRALASLIGAMALPMPGEDEGQVRSPQQVRAAQARWRRERGRSSG